MQTKRTAAAIISAVLALSSITASAEWQFAGYDTRDLGNIGKVYNEVINGEYTNKQKVEAINPIDVEWRTEGYEKAYPHAGYDRLYLEGKKQLITRYNNLFPQWETRFQNYFWEIWGKDVNSHQIYQRQQTNIPGIGWEWDYGRDDVEDSKLFFRTTYSIPVVESFKNYGVGPFTYEGYYVAPEVMDMYRRFGVINQDILTTFEKKGGIGGDKDDLVDASPLSAAKLSERDVNGQYVMSDAEIADLVASIQSKFLEGPSYRGDDGVKDVAAEYLIHGDAWDWDADTLRWGGGQVSWTGLMYEMAEPYNYYQYLIINGIVFDGSRDLPRIWRYTGGKATPNVEWKYFDTVETAPGIYEIIEFKYVDGKLAIDEVTGQPIFRIPTGEYSNTFVKVTPTELQLWVTNKYETKMISSVLRVHDTLGYYDAMMNGGVAVNNF